MTHRTHKRSIRGAAHGMTLVELLVVMAIVLILLSIVVVAVKAATRTAQGASTRTLMTTIKNALVQFKDDVGYYPPVLGRPGDDIDDVTAENHDRRRLFDPRGGDLEWGTDDDILPGGPDGTINAGYGANIQEWYSTTSLPEYLLGYGHHNQDGYGVIDVANPSDVYAGERPRNGIRHPGRDGVWGATTYGAADGALQDRMLSPSNTNLDTGKVFGPYVQLNDDRILGYYPGPSSAFETQPMVFRDYWGGAIRYYRRVYAPGSPDTAYQSYCPDVPTSTLSDVFLLRPFEIDPGVAVDGLADASGDTTTTTALRSAEFALLSGGPDTAINPFIRYDDPDILQNDNPHTTFFNRDNIVELGP